MDFTLLGAKNTERIRESIREILGILLVESAINYSLESFLAIEGAVIANVQFICPFNIPNRIR